MKKIISLFKRDYEGNQQVYDEVVPGAEWVTNGEGVATKKYDGACCMVKDNKLYKRYDSKIIKKGKDKGKRKQLPEHFISAQEPDDVTGHWPGWVPVDKENPADKYFCEAFFKDESYKDAFYIYGSTPDGTYELIGPKVQGNPEGYEMHILIKHGGNKCSSTPRTFNELKEWFTGLDIEGIVWHHPDGRMVKIKKKDFGMERAS